MLMVAATTSLAADLGLKLESTQVQLGQPVWLTLESRQTAVPLDNIDLSPWQGKVVLPRRFDVSRSEDQRTQRLRLQVYPLHAGRLNLPALHFMQQTTPPVQVEVTPARDSKHDSPILFQYHVSTLQPWQQQQVIVACTVTLATQYAVFRQADEDVKTVQLLPMQVQQRTYAEGGRSMTEYRLGWVILPQRPGNLHLQLPPVEYVQDGVVTHRFFVPPIDLAVQALPAWLPGTIPVGQVRVTHYDIASRWLDSSVLSRLRLQLQLEGVTDDRIPAYAMQLRSDGQWQYYAARTQLDTSSDHNGLHQQLRYDIPLLAKHIGLYRLPALRLQYFDPDSGTLRTALIKGPVIVIINNGLKLILLILVLWLLWRPLRSIWRWLLRYRHRYRTYGLALQQLMRADSLAAIKSVMQTMAQAEGLSSNLTFVQWRTRMQGKVPFAQGLAVSDMNAACYGQGEIALVPQIQTLMRICRQRRFALR